MVYFGFEPKIFGSYEYPCAKLYLAAKGNYINGKKDGNWEYNEQKEKGSFELIKKTEFYKNGELVEE